MDNRKTVFIDTNVFLDFLEKRPVGVVEAFRIFGLAATGCIKMLVSDLSIANMKYSTRKTIPKSDFYRNIKLSRELFTIVPVGEQAVDRALALEARDFEDALQYYAAEQAGKAGQLKQMLSSRETPSGLTLWDLFNAAMYLREDDENLMAGLQLAVQSGLCTQEQLDAILEASLD